MNTTAKSAKSANQCQGMPLARARLIRDSAAQELLSEMEWFDPDEHGPDLVDQAIAFQNFSQTRDLLYELTPWSVMETLDTFLDACIYVAFLERKLCVLGREEFAGLEGPK